jgi:hypothetical protein
LADQKKVSDHVQKWVDPTDIYNTGLKNGLKIYHSPILGEPKMAFITLSKYKLHAELSIKNSY